MSTSTITIAFFFCFAIAITNAQLSTPLDAVLNADGTIDPLRAGAASLDPRGYRMTTDANGTPRFVRETTTIPPEVQSDPDDQFWDDRFGLIGADPWVEAMSVGGNNLYVSGACYVAGNITSWNATYSDIYGVFCWNTLTHEWSQVGKGFNGMIMVLSVVGGTLYAGGDFDRAGGVDARNIARFDGTQWVPVGSGVDSTVRAITSRSATEVYVGGDFSKAGDIVVNCIAKWDGTTWSSLGTGMSSSSFERRTVHSIAVTATDLYAGGDYSTAGGVAASCIARWNGTVWSGMGSGVEGVEYMPSS